MSQELSPAHMPNSSCSS